MANGLHAVLSPEEEVALRRLAHGSSSIAPRHLDRLIKLALAERTQAGPRLTALGRQRFEELLQAPVFGNLGRSLRRLEDRLAYWTDQSRRQALPRPRDSLRGVHVMVVEDDYHQAQSFVRALQDVQADVRVPLPSAEAALAAIAAAPSQCAIVDIHLGNGPCYRVPQRLRQQRVPFIFVTAYGVAGRTADYDDVECLDKPIEAAHLVLALSRAYARAASPSGNA